MIVVVGARDLWPTPEVVSSVAALMATTDEEIAIRANMIGHIASGVEEAVSQLSTRTGHHVRAYQPVAGDGRASVFDRDNRMVQGASKVYAFFAPGQEMEGGTGHVVSAAIAKAVCVEAYTLDGHGQVVEWATEEGEPSDHGHPNDPEDSG